MRRSFVEELEAEAIEQLAEIRAARLYVGSSPDYRARAKMAIGVIGAYVRLRATMANEKSNNLIERRLLGEDARDANLRALPAAVSD